MSKYPFMESALFIEATVMPVTSLLRSTKERNLLYLAEVFQSIFLAYMKQHSDTVYSHCQMTKPWPPLPTKFQPPRQKLLMYLYLATGGKQCKEKKSDKKMKIYKHVVLSHKVKEICSYCSMV